MIDIDAWCAEHDVPPVIDGPEVFDGWGDRGRFIGEWSQHMDPEASAMHGALRDQVRKAMAVLGERERLALLAAFGLDDAGHDLGRADEKSDNISRGGARKLEQKSVRILRKRISMFGAWRDECIECEIRERRIEERRRRAAKERDAARYAAVRIERMKWEDRGRWLPPRVARGS